MIGPACDSFDQTLSASNAEHNGVSENFPNRQISLESERQGFVIRVTKKVISAAQLSNILRTTFESFRNRSYSYENSVLWFSSENRSPEDRMSLFRA